MLSSWCCSWNILSTLDYAYMSASLGTHTNTSFAVGRHIFYADRTTQNTMSGPVLSRCSMSIFGAYLPSSLTHTHTHILDCHPSRQNLLHTGTLNADTPVYARHTENAPRAGKHRPNRLAYVLPDNWWHEPHDGACSRQGWCRTVRRAEDVGF